MMIAGKLLNGQQILSNRSRLRINLHLNRQLLKFFTTMIISICLFVAMILNLTRSVRLWRVGIISAVIWYLWNSTATLINRQIICSLLQHLVLKVMQQCLMMGIMKMIAGTLSCLLYTSDAADEEDSVDLG